MNLGMNDPWVTGTDIGDQFLFKPKVKLGGVEAGAANKNASLNR